MREHDFEQAQTFKEVLDWASSFLEKNEKEIGAARWLMKERFDLTPTDLILNRNSTILEEQKKQYKQDIEQFNEGYPPQYIIGHEWFYGRKFKVNESTLIPRPETEEWFDRYIKSLCDMPLTVVDIGTGAGVLAISHKLERPQDIVFATDISKDALDIAKENARNLNAEVEFLQGDLAEPFEGKKFDLILSNPPYIGSNEWDEMDESVRTHEPKRALFAKDHGYEIYKRFAEQIPEFLTSEGAFIVEIGYNQGERVKTIFADNFENAHIEIWKDMSGMDRVVSVQETGLPTFFS